MKQFILITTFAVFSISNLFAQDFTDVKTKAFNFGARLGTSIYTIKAPNDSRSWNGLYAGVFIEKRLSDKWGIQLESNYIGSSILQFPLLLKYKITDKLEIYGGGTLDVSLEQKNSAEVFRNKRFGASLILGAQYNINSHWFIEGRYIHGLTSQFPIFQGFDSQSIYGKKRSFNFGIGYKF
ncbi:porin family protein [Winogradskyella flava]|uniref:porin family protein n=1 Tax=Winogradskyella flava TaxID=1884876 RepID=UPI0024930ABD|nr:porin family protein [Winogradskyella flava]